MAYRGAFPGWLVLDRFVRRRDDESFSAGNPTAASLVNSRGDPFDVCLGLKKPPQPSSLCLWWPNDPTEGEPVDAAAAHDGAVLLLMHYTVPVRGGLPFPMIDYLVYNPAVPSLRLLPSLGGTIAEVQARAEANGLHISKEMARRMVSCYTICAMKTLNQKSYSWSCPSSSLASIGMRLAEDSWRHVMLSVQLKAVMY